MVKDGKSSRYDKPASGRITETSHTIDETKDDAVKTKSKKSDKSSKKKSSGSKKKSTKKLPAENEKHPRSERKLGQSPVSKKKVAEKAESPHAKKHPPSSPAKKKIHPKKHSPKKHPNKHSPKKPVPNIRDSQAWAYVDSDTESSDIDTSDDEPPSRRKKQDQLESQKKPGKREGSSGQRWADLQEQFLIYTNYRLLPGKSVTKQEIVKSVERFRTRKRERPSRQGLELASASVAEIEALFEDWYERKIRDDCQNGIYHGVHLNPKFIIDGKGSNSKSSVESPEPTSKPEVTKKGKSENRLFNFPKPKSKSKMTKKAKPKATGEDSEELSLKKPGSKKKKDKSSKKDSSTKSEFSEDSKKKKPSSKKLSSAKKKSDKAKDGDKHKKKKKEKS